MNRSLISRIAILTVATATGSGAQSSPVQPTPVPQIVAASTAKRAKVPFGPGERMEYDVKFGALSVGSAHMEVVALDNLRGRAAWHTAFWVQGGNFLYRVNDVYESWMDAETLSSLRFVQELEEGRKEIERRFEIYPERAIFVQTTKKPVKEEKSVTQPLDDGSFLYFIRTLPMIPGSSYSFDRHFDLARNPVTVNVIRREVIPTPMGELRVILVEMRVRDPRHYKGEGVIRIHLTDDDCRLPARIQSTMPVVGTATLTIASQNTRCSKP